MCKSILTSFDRMIPTCLDGLSVLQITGCAIRGGYYAVFRQVRGLLDKKLTKTTVTIGSWFSFPT